MLGIKTYLTYFLQNTIYSFGGPQIVRLDPVSYLCNHSCIMCWRQQLTARQKKLFLGKSEQLNALQIGHYKKLLSNLPKSVRLVEIVGSGEPLLYQGIDTLLFCIKSNNVKGSLITNGVLLSKNLVRHIINIQWNDIRISLHAGTRDVYRKIHRVDDFNTVISNIKYILSHRTFMVPNIELHYVLQHDNVNDINNFVDLAESLGVDAINFELLINYKNIKTPNLTEKDLNTIRNTLVAIQRHTRIPNNCSHIFTRLSEKQHKSHSTVNSHKTFCEVAQREVYISSNGYVVPCCFFLKNYVRDANIKNRSLKNIWWDMRGIREQLRKGQYFTLCEKCNYEQKHIPFS